MAPHLSAAAGVVLVIFSASSPSSIEAFAPVLTTGGRVEFPSWRHVMAPVVVLRMCEEEGADDSTGTTVEDSAAPVVAEDASPDSTSVEEEQEEARKKEVDELKTSIASLESSLKAKKYQLSSVKEQIDKYSSAGYARQVASVENAKRVRGAGMADDKSAARASVLQSFLPAFDELDILEGRYGDNAFAKSLDSGLRSELESSMKDLGVSAYVVEAGQSILDVGRVVAVEQEHSEEYARGTAIRMLKAGLEIAGNVIRPAEIVGSLGREGDAAAAEAVVEGEGEAADAGEDMAE